MIKKVIFDLTTLSKDSKFLEHGCDLDQFLLNSNFIQQQNKYLYININIQHL